MSRSNARPLLTAAVIVGAILAIAVGIWAFLRWLRKPLTAVPRVDLDRLAGGWYPIAGSPRVDRKLAPGELTIAHQGLGLLDLDLAAHSAGGEERRRVVALATQGGAAWKLDGGPFGRALQVLALAPDYSACLLGSPDRSVAVVLSRTRTLDRTIWRYFFDELSRQDFKADALRQVSGTRIHLHQPVDAHPAARDTDKPNPSRTVNVARTSTNERPAANGTPAAPPKPAKVSAATTKADDTAAKGGDPELKAEPADTAEDATKADSAKKPDSAKKAQTTKKKSASSKATK